MADANAIINKLAVQLASTLRDNAVLSVEVDELQAKVAHLEALVPKDEPEQSDAR